MSWLRNFIFRNSWDTRCRNTDVARILAPTVDDRTTVLDAGCGERGLASFLTRGKVYGIDTIGPSTVENASAFVHGSILDLPFGALSFDIVTSVDVLEHLPKSLRPQAVAQLLSVAQRMVVVCFPDGTRARDIDETFRSELTRSAQPIPDWLEEHLRSEYPQADEITGMIEDAAKKTGRRVQVSIHRSESLSVARYLRFAAAKSKYLYLASNVLFGSLASVIRPPSEQNSYRAIIVATFDE